MSERTSSRAFQLRQELRRGRSACTSPLPPKIASKRAAGALALSATLAFLSACAYADDFQRAGEAPLPEFYGVYLRDQGELIDLEAPVDGEIDGETGWRMIPLDIGRNPELLIYNKTLAGGGMAAASIQQRLRLQSLVFVRAESPTGEPRDFSRVARRAENDRLPLQFKPIPNEPEMILAVPAQELQDGLYGWVAGGSEPLWFGVGLDENYRRHPAVCRDRWNNVLKPCNEADSHMATWREEAASWFEANRWQDAIASARRILALDATDEAMHALVAEAEAAIAQEAEAEATRLANPRESALKPTTVIGEYEVVDPGEGNLVVKLILTDVNVDFASTTIWFGDLVSEPYPGRRVGHTSGWSGFTVFFPVRRIRRNPYVVIRNEASHDALVRDVRQAVAAWRRKYPDFAKY